MAPRCHRVSCFEEKIIYSIAANHVVLLGCCCGGLDVCKTSGPQAHHTAPPSLLRRIVHRVLGAAVPGQAVSRTQPRKCGGRAGRRAAVIDLGLAQVLPEDLRTKVVEAVATGIREGVGSLSELWFRDERGAAGGDLAEYVDRVIHIQGGEKSNPDLPLLRPPPLCRKLDLAVREEDYPTAAAAKAEVDLLLERLPSSKVVLSGLLSKLGEVGDSSERQATIQQLGKLGDAAAVPSLAGCLHDADPSTAEAAEEALWACFMRQAEVGACSRARVLRLKC